jgi:hypothetical protein
MRLFLPEVGQAAHFYHVSFSCTFVLPKPWRFEDAWIRIVLEGTDGIQPVAQKMMHEAETQPYVETDNVKVGGAAGVPFTAERGRTTSREGLTIVAREEGTSCPEWRLHQQVSSPIKQPPRFTLIIDAPPGVTVDGTAVLGAILAGPKSIRPEYKVPLEKTRHWLRIEAVHP